MNELQYFNRITFSLTMVSNMLLFYKKMNNAEKYITDVFGKNVLIIYVSLIIWETKCLYCVFD